MRGMAVFEIASKVVNVYCIKLFIYNMYTVNGNANRPAPRMSTKTEEMKREEERMLGEIHERHRELEIILGCKLLFYSRNMLCSSFNRLLSCAQ